MRTHKLSLVGLVLVFCLLSGCDDKKSANGSNINQQGLISSDGVYGQASSDGVKFVLIGKKSKPDKILLYKAGKLVSEYRWPAKSDKWYHSFYLSHKKLIVFTFSTGSGVETINYNQFSWDENYKLKADVLKKNVAWIEFPPAQNVKPITKYEKMIIDSDGLELSASKK